MAAVAVAERRPNGWLDALDAHLAAAGCEALLLGPGTLPLLRDPSAAPHEDLIALASPAPQPHGLLDDTPATLLWLGPWPDWHHGWLETLLRDAPRVRPHLALPDALSQAALSLLPTGLNRPGVTLALLEASSGALASFPAAAAALLGPLAGDRAEQVLLEAEWQAMRSRFGGGEQTH